ncbi:hypothetical protein [Bradyrhizobium sp. McL0616]|uniref:hypothetical protein n=1 Tax=Bradyrhizobium sp. McL0616 TaxID=3415674 RepID=UPI003CF933A9
MADPDPDKSRKRIAQLVRMLSTGGGERRNAFAALERAMASAGVTWTDIGDCVEHDADGKYTDTEMQELAQAARAEGVDAGIRIGMARGSNGGGNGHLVLPEFPEMADYCHRHRADLEPKHHDFVDRIPIRARGWRSLSRKEQGYLASLYIQLGGKTG